MKTRKGFVSNSSSSSFVLAINNSDKPEDALFTSMFEAMSHLFKRKSAADHYYPIGNDKDYSIKSIDGLIETLEEEIGPARKEIYVLELIAANKDATSLVDRWNAIRKDPYLNRIKSSQEISQHISAADTVQTFVNSVLRKIKRNENTIEDLKSVREKLLKLGDSTVYSFVVDNSETEIRRFVNEAIKHDLVTVIEEASY